MPLTVLSVAYPLSPVTRDSVGGAEQMLSLLDRALASRGHSSLVLAAGDSRVAGKLIPAPIWNGPLDRATHAEAQRYLRELIPKVLVSERVDLLHFHGVDFPHYLPDHRIPSVATLHLPVDFYPAWLFQRPLPDTTLICVSNAQRRACPQSAAPLRVIPNGICVDEFHCCPHKEDYALVLSRVCPEKGLHHALDAAALARSAVILAGQIYGYPEHQSYFETEIRPRLSDSRRFIGPAMLDRKRDLLARARCLLVPSLVEETSSLVAMEAMASGTPVIAFRRGALPELILPNITGFLVDTVAEMAEAIRNTGAIDPQACREFARENFQAEKCIQQYLALYGELTPAVASGTVAARHAGAEIGEMRDVHRRAGVVGPDAA